MSRLITPEIQIALAAERAAATKAIPRLHAHRQDLEKEAGALAVAKQRLQAFTFGCGGGAVIVGLYALWTTAIEAPSVVAWSIAVILGSVAVFVTLRSNQTEGSRSQYLEELHTKMLSVGRRIDGAKRKLRD